MSEFRNNHHITKCHEALMDMLSQWAYDYEQSHHGGGQRIK